MGPSDGLTTHSATTESITAHPEDGSAGDGRRAPGGLQPSNIVQHLIASFPTQVFYKDAQSKFVMVSPAFARELHRQPADFVGRSDFDFFPQDLAAKYQADDQRIMGSGQSETFEERNVVAGQIRYVEVTKTPVCDDSGTAIGLLGTFADVTERRLAQEEIARSRVFLNSVIEHLPMMVFIKRAHDLRLVLWNRASSELTGRRSDEVIGRADHEIFPAEEAEGYERSDRQALSSGKLIEVPEEVMQTPHKGYRILRTRKIPITDADGVPRFVLGLSEDVTERRAAEEKLWQFAARLEQNNQELQEFAYVASHDLQEPLRKIRAFGDRLAAKCAANLSDEGRDYLSRMVNAAQRMQGLIDDLLAFSRVSTRAQPFASVDLNEIARGVLCDLEVRIEQAQGVVEIGELPKIEADATQMRQLFQNLIGNALKFHKPKQPPIVKVYARTGDNLRSHAGPGVVRLLCQIIVEDNGIGFDEKYLDRIFTVFQRLHGRGEYEGSGVGLAICRKIVQRHHGEITARSQPGHGATFIVTMPIQQSMPVPRLANNPL